MTKKRKKDKPKKDRTLGDLEPRHRFFLNSYQDVRFTRCPICDKKTKIRKRPFGVHIDPQVLMNLNMSGPYCPDCDLIILHQDTVESLLAMTFTEINPEIVGNDYLIVGTVERSYWRKASKQGGTYKEFLENLHDFAEALIFEPMHYGWLPDDKETE